MILFLTNFSFICVFLCHSVQFKMVCIQLEKPTHLSKISPMLPVKQFPHKGMILLLLLLLMIIKGKISWPSPELYVNPYISKL